LADESFAVYCGSDEINLPALAAGASGLISVLANLFPRDCAALCEHVGKGELAAARAIQHRYSALIAALFSEPNPIPVKTAMNALFLPEVGKVGGFRLPLCEMGEAPKMSLLRELARLG
ncbi:MAG: dihydrodipicolinate synthase family protein, partial [Clostridia bacterium]|nr:dihydrodipicolinate synthase family protein [Clostridia bacterium]